MANRNFNRFQSLEKEIKAIYVLATVGAAGAITLDAANSKGVASITKAATGRYQITLQDKYNSLVHADVSILSSAAQDLVPQLVSEAVSTAKTVTFRTNAAGVEADPTSGSVLRIRLDLKNSSVR